MRQDKKGWLLNYIESFKSFTHKEKFKDYIRDKITSYPNVDDFLYHTVQSTGLMYGFPVKLAEEELIDISGLEEDDKMKVILIDSLLNYSLFYKNQGFHENENIETVIDEVTCSIKDFYLEVFPGIKDKEINNASDNVVEVLIERRVQTGKKWSNTFWTSYFKNSLLFLDVIYFSKWMQKESKERLIKEKEDVYFLIIKIIAASANANSVIENEEKALFENFLNSAKMKEENVKKANDYFYKGVKLESIDFEGIDSWIIKKYLLEISILTIWSDRVVDQEELVFLEELNAKLGFSKQDFEASMIAIESFVLSHWNELPYINKNNDYDKIYGNLIERTTDFINRNIRDIDNEIFRKDEFKQLLQKSVNNELSNIEKQKIKLYLRKYLKTIPSLAIFLLPGGSVMLPLLLKLLPDKFLNANKLPVD